jgi:transcriptional regulator with XRE-family HTH domain
VGREPAGNGYHPGDGRCISQNLTQKELAERTGINQADISKLENGTRNPSLKLLKRLADGMGMDLKLVFTPKEPQNLKLAK